MKTINDYAELVKAEHALNKTIAPVEDGANIAGSYTSGKQFIRGGVLYTALTTIAANTAWSSLTLDTDYELADDITSQLASLNQTLTNDTYNVNDTAITEVASNDLLPIYDTSATAKKKIAVGNFVGGLVSNRNLLDNPWFTVNQRGFTSTTSAGYTVDRWRLNSSGTVTANADNSITLGKAVGESPQFIQIIEPSLSKKLDGKVVTLSAIVDDVLYSETFTYENDDNFIQQLPIKNEWVLDYRCLGSADNQHFVRFLTSGTTQASSITVKAVKLELGSVSTLAMDTAPNYATELLKCQRYFERIGGTTYEQFGMGFFIGTNLLEIIGKCAPKRAIPTITMNGTVYCWDVDHQGGEAFQSTTLGTGANCSLDGRFYLPFSVSGVTSGNVGFAQFRDSTSYIDISADL